MLRCLSCGSVVLVACLVLAGCSKTPARPDGPTISCYRIEFGWNTFESGSSKFTPSGLAEIDRQLGGISRGASVRVEVFADARAIHPHGRPDIAVRLSQARADALAAHLVSRGIPVEAAIGRGFELEGERPPDRRSVVIVQE